MKKKRRVKSIIECIDDPSLFAPWFKGDSWNSWRAFLKVLFNLPLSSEEIAIIQRHTARDTLPEETFRECWLVIGRRGGKSLISALIAVYLSCFKDYRE